MKLLVVSDSHGDNESLEKLALIYPNMDLYLHLGDSESDEFSIKPFISVKGNCDFYPNFENRLIIPTPLGNIFASHYQFISKNELVGNKTRFFLHGHTHKRRFDTINDITYLNPGSISFSRDGHDLSYMILEITTKGFEVSFKSLDDKSISK